MEGMTKRKWAKTRRSVAFSADDNKWLDQQAKGRNVSVSELLRLLVGHARYSLRVEEGDRTYADLNKMIKRALG